MEIAELAKSMNPDLPVIMITAYATPADDAHLDRIGIDRLLHKPFLIEDLLEAVAGTISAPPSSRVMEG